MPRESEGVEACRRLVAAETGMAGVAAGWEGGELGVVWMMMIEHHNGRQAVVLVYFPREAAVLQTPN